MPQTKYCSCNSHWREDQGRLGEAECLAATAASNSKVVFLFIYVHVFYKLVMDGVLLRNNLFQV